MRSVLLPLTCLWFAVGSWIIADDAPVEDRVALESGGFVRAQALHRGRVLGIETHWGGRLELLSSEIAVVAKETHPDAYEVLKAKVADSPSDHWRAAQWCGERGLAANRQTHLERILELDPQHVPARRALGYHMIHGQWIQRTEYLEQRGYRRHAGSWVLGPEVQLLEAIQQERRAADLLKDSIVRLIRDYQRSPSVEGLNRLAQITDPRAAAILNQLIWSVKDAAVVHAMIQSLGHLPTQTAVDGLLDVYFYANSDAYRQLAVDQFSGGGRQLAERRLIKALGHRNNKVVNRASEALGVLGNAGTIGPLIDALISRHHPDDLDRSLARLPASPVRFIQFDEPTFGLGDRQSAPLQAVENPSVLAALVRITEGVNFGYEQRAWSRWHISATQISAPIDNLRRGL
jgi:hypothetical protein